MAALVGALLLTYVGATDSVGQVGPSVRLSRLVGCFSVASAGLLWITVLVGTYLVFPPYRVAPPEGATDLTAYPRSMVLADPSTAWLHSFGMEIKEHVPWIAAMLATAAAFVVVRYGGDLSRDPSVGFSQRCSASRRLRFQSGSRPMSHRRYRTDERSYGGDPLERSPLGSDPRFGNRCVGRRPDGHSE